jgi:alpha-beta hydrolase superfamily lysophospholipase
MPPQAEVPVDDGDDRVGLAYRRPRSRGPVVVLCHGIIDSGPSWSHVAEQGVGS